MTSASVQAEARGTADGPATPGLRTVNRRVPELDGLRGLAILLVIICHYVANAEHRALGFWTGHALSALTIGWSGVDLFFVLSGFLIGGILLEARNSTHYFRAFYMRRVFRILPVYYAWILIYALVVLGAVWFFPGRSTAGYSSLLRVPVQLLFLQNIFIGMAPFTWAWFAATWSLAVEEQFYLVAPPLIRWLSMRNLVVILSATICVAPLLRFLVFRYWFPGTFAADFLMPCRADELAWGILLAVAWRQAWFHKYLQRNRLLLQRTFMVLVLGAVALLWWLVRPGNVIKLTIGLTWMGLLHCTLLVLVLSQTEGWVAGVMRWRVLRWLGGISYCVYIVHHSFNVMAHRMVLHAEPQIYNLRGVGVSLLALGATLGVASLSWRWFESPLIRRGHSYIYQEMSAER